MRRSVGSDRHFRLVGVPLKSVNSVELASKPAFGIGWIHQIGIEEVEFFSLRFAGRDAMLVSFVDPLPFRPTVATLHGTIVGDQISTTVLADAAKASGISCLEQ